MLRMALNHMTMARATTQAMLDVAREVGCTDVELRNDLSSPAFEGVSPAALRSAAAEAGVQICGVAEVYGFTDNTDQTRRATAKLARTAKAMGAPCLALIPRVGTAPMARADHRRLLKDALIGLRPVLEGENIVGLIEPLGFENSTLRYKADVICVLRDLGNPTCFGMIHDTFHHALSGENKVFADLTHSVHVSGVAVQTVALDQLTDQDRGLVGPVDRLGSVQQIRHLRAEGYVGPISIEAFAPEVHALSDPRTALRCSIEFMNSQILAAAA